MASKLTNAFRVAIILFPALMGLFLVNLGTGRLNEAYATPTKSWAMPYGFLIFSTMKLQEGEMVEAHFWIDNISPRNGTVRDALIVWFARLAEPSVGEQVIGFQIPYVCRVSKLTIQSQNRTFEALETRTMYQVDESMKEPSGMANTTLVYARFLSSPEVNEYFGDLSFVWEGPVKREGFSSYLISIPFADSGEGDTHPKVYEYFPNASAHCVKMSIFIGIHLPQGCEYEGSIMPPSQEQASVTQTTKTIMWRFVNPTLMGLPLLVNHFTMSFENSTEAELRDRLLFDSGLYMGLGVERTRLSR